MSIAIGDNFELMHPEDDGFIVDDVLVRGGYSIVRTIAERDSIPPSARKEGMIVYVQTPKLEYKLVDGIANTNWVIRNTMVDDGTTYARLDSPHFTGDVTYTQPNVTSQSAIAKFSEVYNNDPDMSFIEISLTEEEKSKIGMYTAIRSANDSNVTAIILDVRPNGLVIPSINSPKSKPEYRQGTFIQGEKIMFTAGAVIAQKDEQLVTLAGLNANAIPKKGGKVFGELEIRPVYRYVTVSTVKDIVDETSLGICYVKMDFTAEDLKHVHGGMEIEVINASDNSIGDKIKTVRLMTFKNGFIINLSDKTKIAVGRKIRVMSSVMMPVQSNHAVCKEYVDGIVRPIVLQLKAASFVKNTGVSDLMKALSPQRTVYRYTISSDIFSKEHLPLFKLYVDKVVGVYTYKYEIVNPDVRVALRNKSDGTYDLVVEFWSDSDDFHPIDCEIHII